MGMCTPKTSKTRTVKVIKILKRPIENEPNTFENITKINIKKNPVRKIINYLFVIQRNAWKIVIDFLSYKDLHQAGRVNR